ncbi:uncharacterized protein BHQ10_002757 [Talaromyces amestolkiae]|uniref:Protein kinase domain-containing protein n=1 Tax=Talaromyces amestolkiae TaxID=1196081 RepID=A0A364KT69_TALAM|nr:uncharacterized protein BHQ10_002757 [Talaromyces amestolkiae]RAO66745.1 hypothetical protein BHQ10_002757 [Talaromyces amestolkiae]
MSPARCNLREVSFSHLFPLEAARALSGGLAMAVASAHSRGFVHGDIHLRNVLSPLPNAANSRFLPTFRPPLVMRPPEARFAPLSPLSYSADIWSLAFAIWEIIGMKAIFSSEFATADDVFAQQIDVLGASSLPPEWWDAWEQRSNFFSSSSDQKIKIPREDRYVWPPLDEAFEEGVQKYRRQSQKVKEFDEEEMTAILELMRRMFGFRPEDRLTADEVLQSNWMVKWALPEFFKTLEMM